MTTPFHSYRFDFRDRWIFEVVFDRNFKTIVKTQWQLATHHSDRAKAGRSAVGLMRPAEKLNGACPQYVAREFLGPLKKYLESGGPLVLPLDDFLDFSPFTPLQKQIYRCLQKVHGGQVLSYSELADRAGATKAARAVGSTMKKNPWPLLVPCHRVVCADGSLGAYSAPEGTMLKQQLLRHEGVMR